MRVLGEITSNGQHLGETVVSERRKAGMVTVLIEVKESRSGKTVFGDRKDHQLGETVLLLKERTSILVK